MSLKLVFTFVLSYIAGTFVSQYGQENEWSLTKRAVVGMVVGGVIGFICGVVFI